MIRFIKDHLTHKAGDEVADHPHEDYLIKMGVAEQVREKKEHKESKEKKEISHTKEKKSK